MILECSSRGDKRFSAFYAYVKVNGVNDSIEHHYQNAKRPIPKKGAKPEYLEIGGNHYPTSCLTAWYLLLWVKYLDEHPELVEFAKQFDDFHDMFVGAHTLNSQADAVRLYVKQGRKSIMQRQDVQDFLHLMHKYLVVGH